MQEQAQTKWTQFRAGVLYQEILQLDFLEPGGAVFLDGVCTVITSPAS